LFCLRVACGAVAVKTTGLFLAIELRMHRPKKLAMDGRVDGWMDGWMDRRKHCFRDRATTSGRDDY
jgi:hypothetical protein